MPPLTGNMFCKIHDICEKISCKNPVCKFYVPREDKTKIVINCCCQKTDHDHGYDFSGKYGYFLEEGNHDNSKFCCEEPGHGHCSEFECDEDPHGLDTYKCKEHCKMSNHGHCTESFCEEDSHRLDIDKCKEHCEMSNLVNALDGVAKTLFIQNVKNGDPIHIYERRTNSKKMLHEDILHCFENYCDKDLFIYSSNHKNSWALRGMRGMHSRMAF